MDMFKYINGLTGETDIGIGRSEIETSRGLITIDVLKSTVDIPFNVEIRAHFKFDEKLIEIANNTVEDPPDIVPSGYLSLEISYIISDDEMLVVYWKWETYISKQKVSLITQVSDN